MILNPLLRVQLRSAASSWFKQSRNVRPTVKIDKDHFQLTIDVRQFNKNEIRVKARPEYVIVEGKQERKTKQGCVIRQFVRKFQLPQGCNPANMKSKLSPDGILTVTAHRKSCDANFPCETLIPISGEEKPAEVNDPFVDKSDKIGCDHLNKKPGDK